MFLSFRWRITCDFCRSTAGLLLLVAAFSGCDRYSNVGEKGSGLSQGESVERQGKIRIVARISRYQSEAVFDDYADGTSAVYDLSVLEIIEPKKYKGVELSVVHDAPAAPDSIWFKSGAVYSFELDEDVIGKREIRINAQSLKLVGEQAK